MPPLTADVEQAARRVVAGSVPPEVWNPVYRALVPAPERAPARRGQEDPTSAEILRRHFTSPALLVVATTEGASTRRLRIGLHPDAATLEASRGRSPSTWASVSRDRIPALVEELLAPVGLGGAPHLGVRRESAGLRLTPGQIEQVRHELSRGTAAPEAFSGADGIDEHLLDALTADGARAAVSLTLHDPSGRHLQAPETSESWSRLWVRGERSLYRMDDSQAALGPVHLVADGDVLGTVLPVLQEGLRFAAACSDRTQTR
ncbi:hypothetical protein [Brachybacterium fresconis]|uniref:ESX secretion-associated protein EspG n=1 Tax=Brachybacterium fresconis TaxID=173363 RepID=A0ABS4YPK2_9MICO|nr:hypothetical protein [Brachybacterium fresconis]MBP2410731.1 hypothetical protein [Brachybacterium fresconis]